MKTILLITVFAAVGFSCNLDAEPLPMGENNEAMMMAYKERNANHVSAINSHWKARRACNIMQATGDNWVTCMVAMSRFYYIERADFLAEQQYNATRHGGRY